MLSAVQRGAALAQGCGVDDGDRGGAASHDRGRGLVSRTYFQIGLSPKPRTQVVEVKTPQAAPPSAQYVAVLQKDGGRPASHSHRERATRNFTIRKVDAAADPTRARTWLISDSCCRRSRALAIAGVIGGSDFTRVRFDGYDPDLINTATYA